MKIREVKKKDKKYYYLEHSFREDNKVRKKSLYLGTSVPKKIDVIREKFRDEFYEYRYFGKLEKIRKGFSEELARMPKVAKDKEFENFGIVFTYNSQRIEGSTLTLKETADFLQRGITPSKKPIVDVKEAENHEKMFRDMFDSKKMDFQKVLFWNEILFKGTNEDIGGKVRRHDVRIARSKFVPPMYIELDFLLKDFFDWYKKNKGKVHPVILAALVHLKFVTIHPFSDGNGRTSRIMMNFVLKDCSFPMMDIVYEKRESYYDALEKSNLNPDEGVFVEWFLKVYIKEHVKYL